VETGSVRKVDTGTNVAFGRLEVALGEAECAAMQTVHFTDSLAFACWCIANANADQNVSTRHSQAMRFDIDRMSVTP
jgi:hypothetical protein